MNLKEAQNKLNFKYLLLIFVLASITAFGIFWYSNKSTPSFITLIKPYQPKNYTEQDEFRNSAINFIRSVAESYFGEKEIQYPKKLETEGSWNITIFLYKDGKLLTKGSEIREGGSLYSILEKTTQSILKGISRNEIQNSRFLITFYRPPEEPFSIIEYKGEGKEVLNDLVITRQFTKEQLLKKIEEAKNFLFRMNNSEEGGFYKKYEATNDFLEKRLHTVYTASIIYTLLNIYDFDKDEKILEKVPEWTDFILSMQSKEKETYGAFHYSYYYEKEEKEMKFPVGTTALSIFTLLDVFHITGDPKYLEGAKLGADWLLTMQMENGVMRPQRIFKNGSWMYYDEESLLYNGQVLAALSRLFLETKEQKYYNAARKIADHFNDRVKKEGCYLGDDYRIKNPISSAWVVMALLDFYKINKEEVYKEIIFKCSRDLLKRQQSDPKKILYYGTWTGAYSTSGNGWLAEVMMEMYRFCREQEGSECGDYKEAVVKVIWWLIQNTYSEENSYLIENSERARGGLFWNYNDKYVRTDSVCHGGNAYVGIINDLEEGILISLPEKPLEEILEEIKKPST